jgi:hypothetical protein
MAKSTKDLQSQIEFKSQDEMFIFWFCLAISLALFVFLIYEGRPFSYEMLFDCVLLGLCVPVPLLMFAGRQDIITIDPESKSLSARKRRKPFLPDLTYTFDMSDVVKIYYDGDNEHGFWTKCLLKDGTSFSISEAIGIERAEEVGVAFAKAIGRPYEDIVTKN